MGVTKPKETKRICKKNMNEESMESVISPWRVIHGIKSNLRKAGECLKCVSYKQWFYESCTEEYGIVDDDIVFTYGDC